MPMPPHLAKLLAYSSVRNDRHGATPLLLPNGPSPPTSSYMCWNIELRNWASKLCACARMRACGELGLACLLEFPARAASDGGASWSRPGAASVGIRLVIT